MATRMLTGLCWMLAATACTALPLRFAGDGRAAALRVDTDYGRLPLSFEANQGQADPAVGFVARGPGYGVRLEPAGATLVLQEMRGEPAVVRVRFVGANAAAAAAGLDRQAGTSNYFIGPDPARWRVAVPNYAKVKVPGVYPGIDVVWYGTGRQLEYDFVVAPGADPRRIALEFGGVRRASLDREGNLVLATSAGTLVQHRPIAYQEIDGLRQPIDARYVLHGRSRASIALGRYDTALPLVIDPVLAYSTYVSGTGDSSALRIAVDAQGNAYVAGATAAGFPISPGAPQPAYGGGDSDVYVTKLNADGTAVLYSTYLGGSAREFPNGLAVDKDGNAYVTGTTFGGFPTTPGALRTSFAGTGYRAFVTKLDPTGTALVYSTYLASGGQNSGEGIAVDGNGNVYLTGQADALFPTTAGAYRTAPDVQSAGFLAKLNAGGTALIYSTFLSAGIGVAVAIDAPGNAYVTGTVTSGLTATPGAYQGAPGGDSDGFVCKFNASATAAVYCTYLGGSGYDAPQGIAVDGAGNAHVTGATGGNFPVTAGAVQAIYGGGFYDAFVAKLTPAGTALVYSTYLGGSGTELPGGIAVDGAGRAWVTGGTEGPIAVTDDAFQPTVNLQGDAYVTAFGPTGALFYSTYLGGNDGGYGAAIAVDGAGNVYLTGTTFRPTIAGFPTTPGPLQAVMRGDIGAFVVKFAADAASVPLNYQGLWWRSPAGSESGWGINFAHQGDIVFATWFTYDADRKPLWLAAVLEKVAPGVYTGSAFTTTGPPLDALPWEPSQVVETTVGALTVAFADTEQGTLYYTVFGVTQSKPIVRQRFAAPVPGCYFGRLVDLSQAISYQGLWWKSPAGAESGWGVNFTQQGYLIFVTWYTYGADGKPLWLIAVAELQGEDDDGRSFFVGPISTVSGPPFDAVPWDPATVVETVVGELKITFIDGNRATYAYTVNGIAQVKEITRLTFVEPGTVCQ